MYNRNDFAASTNYRMAGEDLLISEIRCLLTIPLTIKKYAVIESDLATFYDMSEDNFVEMVQNRVFRGPNILEFHVPIQLMFYRIAINKFPRKISKF